MEQLIEDWDYLLNDDSEIAHQIKELVNDASDHYIHDFWTETPTETLASVDGDFLLELKPLLVQYSGEPMDKPVKLLQTSACSATGEYQPEVC